MYRDSAPECRKYILRQECAAAVPRKSSVSRTYAMHIDAHPLASGKGGEVRERGGELFRVSSVVGGPVEDEGGGHPEGGGRKEGGNIRTHKRRTSKKLSRLPKGGGERDRRGTAFFPFQDGYWKIRPGTLIWGQSLFWKKQHTK